MNFREDTRVSDNLGITVNRYNSWQRRVKRALGVERKRKPAPVIVPNHNCRSSSLNIKDHTFACGFLTARVRRWDDELKAYHPWNTVSELTHNNLVNTGRDFFHTQCYKDTGLATSGMNWVAITTTTPGGLATDTTLPGEVTASGCARQQATGSAITHTALSGVTTIAVTYTATGTVTGAVGSGIFSTGPAVGGVMSHEAPFTSTTLNSGDQLGLSWTLNLG